MEGHFVRTFFALVFLFALTFLSFTPRQDYELLIIGLLFAFGAWFGLMKGRAGLLLIISIATLARLVFFKHLPLLSDDYYRFIWDGNLLLNGINPIGKIPVQTKLDSPLSGLLLTEMNSRDYPSVYPPLHQVGLAFGAIFGSPESRVNGMRLFIILCEAIGFFYFARFSRERLSLYSVYLLHPLVILEGVGNVHFEGALLPFLAIALDRAEKEKPIGGGLWLGAAIITKLNPLMLLPAFWNHFQRRKKLIFGIAVSAFCFVAFLPFIGGLIDSFSGFDLYFRKFEFNASLYYLVSELGKQAFGYNPISILGPVLGLIAGSLILFLAFRPIALAEKALLTYLVFFALSTTVHPWYLIPLVFLALITDRQAILVWSFTTFFSYTHYLGELAPKFPWIIAEYMTLLLALVYSYRKKPIQLFRG